jgi:hypothetical protein
LVDSHPTRCSVIVNTCKNTSVMILIGVAKSCW